jgi:hypothetical protein
VTVAVSHAFGYTGIGSLRIGSTERYDDRELYFVLDHPHWNAVAPLEPKYSEVAHELTAIVNGEAKRQALTERAASQDVASSHATASGDVATQLHELAELHRQGALTDAEFEAAKRRVLED